MCRISFGDIRIGFRRCGNVALGQRRQQTFLERGPEAAHFLVGFLHELRFDRRVKIGFGPEFTPLVVFLLELRNPVAVNRKLRRITQRKGGFEIGFDNVFRRRRDIGDEIIAELDLVVERAAHL
jgi:hypothetical protein